MSLRVARKQLGADPAPRPCGALARSLALLGVLAGVARAEAASAPAAAPDTLARLCGGADAALEAGARELLARRLAGGDGLAPAELEEGLRQRGSSYLWPEAWALSGLGDETELSPRLAAWVGQRPPKRRPRCGVAVGRDSAGRWAISAVVVDALAETRSLPGQARPGQWLQLDAALFAPASGVHVVLLGPRGRPRRVPSTLVGGEVRSRFALDQPGRWLVQLVAQLAEGPLPVLETRILVGEPSAVRGPTERAPGAELVDGDEPRLLGRMLLAARRAEGLTPLGRDPELDRLAQKHAEAMARAGKIGHDLGDGSPDERVGAEGLSAGRVGENVASAPTIARAHQSLWASPSHRENMLDDRFVRYGVGVARDGRGVRWVTELLSD